MATYAAIKAQPTHGSHVRLCVRLQTKVQSIIVGAWCSRGAKRVACCGRGAKRIAWCGEEEW
ncbi:hypothetical protein LOZ80_21530 [Paenibacillus sp. HWE-109]|uniref:hypothetical protein n=1 Tax=Paenibacillus sp. HWE-109 TaxID=1306526 RepID=UPI001EE03138|nr:hypothetical protein [Paenibacillus sp. HWE-109]UKS24207.1 hypothetical protein LOZ80_21530 [Paenibacillus sp. HWE-109]